MTSYPVNISPLLGTEMIRVQPVVAATGKPSGEDFLATTQAIANLAEQSGTLYTATLYNPTLYTATLTNATVNTITLVGGTLTTVTINGPTINTATLNTPTANTVTIVGGTLTTVTLVGAAINTSTAVGLAGTTCTLTGSALTTCTIVGSTLTTVTLASGSSSPAFTLTDPIYGTMGRNSATITATNTMVAITGLSVNLATSGVYQINSTIPVVCNGTGGVAIEFYSPGPTCTLTSENVYVRFSNTTTSTYVASLTTTTLATAVGQTSTCQLIELEGVVALTNGGTLAIYGSTSSNNGTVTFLPNAYMSVMRYS